MFVGRRDELSRFAAIIDETLSNGSPTWFQPRKRRRFESTPGQSKVVVVSGLGGSGKSSLLRQLQELAQGGLSDFSVPARRIRTAWIDWEDEQRQQPSSYADLEGPALTTVLDTLQKAVVESAGESKRNRVQGSFASYRLAAAHMPEYAERFAALLSQGEQGGTALTDDDKSTLIKAAVSAGLLGIGHSGASAGSSPSKWLQRSRLRVTCPLRRRVRSRDPDRA